MLRRGETSSAFLERLPDEEFEAPIDVSEAVGRLE